ncbi:unnamed protein product [Microthlaspi erraticum]|uniref:Uncharacterized protein n=1 Tax=Microthlaspi erraticum TaxID=1685480 RepID=A0A6D2J8Q3_9BRAS|nr:unnamed protein product [Microthlaspi erraticum]
MRKSPIHQTGPYLHQFASIQSPYSPTPMIVAKIYHNHTSVCYNSKANPNYALPKAALQDILSWTHGLKTFQGELWSHGPTREKAGKTEPKGARSTPHRSIDSSRHNSSIDPDRSRAKGDSSIDPMQGRCMITRSRRSNRNEELLILSNAELAE